MTENSTRPARKAPAPGKEGSPWSVRRRRPRDHDLKREAVVRAAARAFNARGYHNTSLDDVAADLGVTKPTVYYYVSNKEQLLFECFRTGLEQIREAFRTAERIDRPARERLDAVIRGYAEAIASDYGWCMVRAHEHDLGPELGRRINALKSSIAACDPRITAFAIAGALNGIAHWYRDDQPMSPAQVAEAFARFFEQGLLPRPGRPGGSRA